MQSQLDADTSAWLAAKSRTGGAYMPPARLAALQREAKDPNTPEFQRIAWEALKKSVNGIINKVNVGNIRNLVGELFAENLVRARGLFARSVMRAQVSRVKKLFRFCFSHLVATGGFADLYADLRGARRRRQYKDAG